MIANNRVDTSTVPPGRDRRRALRSSFVHVIDASAVLILLVAVCVLLFGGFREFIGSVRVSVRSADRLVVAAILLIAVRHVLVREPSMWTTMAWWRARVVTSDAFGAAWPAFVATRFPVLVVGYLAVVMIGIVPGTERFRVSDNAVENLLARWDAQWYLSIVQQGYLWNGNPRIEQNVVFFPAFPVAVRVLGPLLGDRWLFAGLVLALAAFLFALVYVFRLARELMPAERAHHAVWLVAAYPFAVYYSAPYTESFYLLGAVATFFHTSRAEYWRAAAWGFFLALCRPNGFFIALPVVLFVLQRLWIERRVSLSAIAACLAPGCGVLVYTLYLYVRFGDGLVWMKGQQAWGRVFVGLGPGLYALFFDRVKAIASEGFEQYVSTNPYDFVYTCAAVFALASLWPCVRRFGLPYAVFVAINIVPPLLMGGMMSIGRMTSVLFPSFLWLAAALPQRVLLPTVIAFALLQALVAALFFTWRPVF
jgi:hypothetical protein